MRHGVLLSGLLLLSVVLAPGCPPGQPQPDPAQQAYNAGYDDGYYDAQHGLHNDDVESNPRSNSPYYWYDLGYNDGYRAGGGGGGGGGGNGPYCVALVAIADYYVASSAWCSINGQVVARGGDRGASYLTPTPISLAHGTQLTVAVDAGGLQIGSQIVVTNAATHQIVVEWHAPQPSGTSQNRVTKTLP